MYANLILDYRIIRLYIFSDESLLDRLTNVAANPFQNWSYSTSTDTSVTTSKDSISVTDVISQKPPETIAAKVQRRGRKRGNIITPTEHEAKRAAIDFKSNKEKEDKNEKDPKEQIQLQELYYATMEGDKNLVLKELRVSLYFKVCSKFLCCHTISMFIFDKYIFWACSVSSVRL